MPRPGNRCNAIRVILAFLLILFSVNSAGCWDRREIPDLSINTALGIDRIVVEGRPKFLVSVVSIRVTAADGGAGGGGGTTAPRAGNRGVVLSMEGDTIYDAVRNMALRFSRQLFLSHTMVVVIGEETAQGGINEIMEFCHRQKDLRERTWMVVCEGLARDALQVVPEFEGFISMEMLKLLDKNRPRVSKTEQADLFQVSYSLLTPGLEAALPNMKLFIPPETSSPVRRKEDIVLPQGEGGSPAGVPGTGEGGGEEVLAQNKTFVFSGAAVFRGDRMAGRLDEEETQGLQFITGRAGGGVIPFAFGAEETNSSFLFRRTKAKINPVVNGDGTLTFEVRIKGEGELIEQNDAAIDLSPEDIKQAEALISQEVERRCLKAAARAQELGSDVFGFGNKLHRTKPKVWKEVKDQWESVFPTVKVSVQADMKTEHLGIINRPFSIQ